MRRVVTMAAGLAVVLLAWSAMQGDAYVEGDGKGKAEADCLIGLEGYDDGDLSPFGKKGKPAIQCTDCDPACDLDGASTPNGSCTFSIAVRVNDGGDPACTPAALKKVKAKAKTKGTKIDFSTSFQPPLDGSSATSAFVNFPVLVKVKKKGDKPGTGKVQLLAKTAAAPKLTDKDKFTFVCNPLPEGEVCPAGTTSTTIETTTTTVETTSTTVETTSTTVETTTTTVQTTTTTLETTTTTVETTTTTLETTTTTVETTTTTLETTTTTIGPICGDGVINQESEECDGEDIGDAECPGSPTGAFPACTVDCLLDFAPCEGGTTSTTVETTTTTVETTTTTVETTTTTLETTTTTEPSTTTTSTSTSTTTSTAPPIAAVLAFTTGQAGGVCGEIRTGGASGSIIRNLTCGGLNVGGGCYQGGGSCGVAEGPTPANATTNFNALCTGSTCDVTARTAAQTGSNNDCSDTGCQFGTWLSIANGGTSTCVLNTFASPGSGTFDLDTGGFEGSVPLTSAVTLTGNGAAPCPRCLVGGVPGQGAGVCSGVAANPGAACTGVNSTGDSYECLPSGVPLTPFGVDLTPIRTGVAFMDTTTDQDQVPGGVVGQFCPGQDATEPGSYGCFATTKLDPPGVEPVCDYIEERGSPAAGIAIDGGPVDGTLASVFCIPAAGNAVIDGAADLAGPGATSLPGTLELTSVP